jgi:serine/threonine protein kinase
MGDEDPGDNPPGVSPLEPELDAVFGFRDDGWQKRAARAVQPASPMGSLAGYSLIQELGRGGQGSVYKAIQPGTGRIVAIKRLGSAVLLGERQSERFHERYRAEIEAVTRLQHPCIVTVHTAEVLDGHPVLVMEFVQGEPIDRWAQEQWLHARDPVSAVLACFLRVCEGVSHAHTRGVIHRDLKPSNILVTGREGDSVVAGGDVGGTGCTSRRRCRCRSLGQGARFRYCAPARWLARRGAHDLGICRHAGLRLAPSNSRARTARWTRGAMCTRWGCCCSPS